MELLHQDHFERRASQGEQRGCVSRATGGARAALDSAGALMDLKERRRARWLWLWWLWHGVDVVPKWLEWIWMPPGELRRIMTLTSDCLETKTSDCRGRRSRQIDLQMANMFLSCGPIHLRRPGARPGALGHVSDGPSLGG
ncbi:unnamed protein product [Durusdinium trenchii]|uniref:Uncharacterized protein n=2 Tax=Durusdinium trenchii TaxID=1381693 RepID=A0ABP0R940_9DINO